MTPQTVNYDVRGIYDALDNLIGVQVVYGTRTFTWSIVRGELVLVAI